MNTDIRNESFKIKTGFLFCPRCGLRMPRLKILSYYGGYCPNCGCRMKEEYYLPYNVMVQVEKDFLEK